MALAGELVSGSWWADPFISLILDLKWRSVTKRVIDWFHADRVTFSCLCAQSVHALALGIHATHGIPWNWPDKAQAQNTVTGVAYHRPIGLKRGTTGLLLATRMTGCQCQCCCVGQTDHGFPWIPPVGEEKLHTKTEAPAQPTSPTSNSFLRPLDPSQSSKATTYREASLKKYKNKVSILKGYCSGRTGTETSTYYKGDELEFDIWKSQRPAGNRYLHSWKGKQALSGVSMHVWERLPPSAGRIRIPGHMFDISTDPMRGQKAAGAPRVNAYREKNSPCPARFPSARRATPPVFAFKSVGQDAVRQGGERLLSPSNQSVVYGN
jgi:hypothetical protein